MTAPVLDLQTYKDRLSGLDPSRFIGSILWFSITGTTTYVNGKRESHPVRVKHDQLEIWFDELGLDKKFLPPPIKAVDAFRKSTSEVSREYELDSDGKTATLMVREVSYDDEQVVRHVVKETRDRRGQKLDYDPHLATLKFLRGGRTTKGRRPGGETFKSAIMNHVQADDRTNVETLLDEANDRYKDLATNLHADAIRAVIRNYLMSLNAIAVKPSGGVYFVHLSKQPTVDALQELIRRVSQGCSFHQLPLLDTGEQREMLNEAFQTEVEDETRKLLADIATFNDKAKGSGGKVPPTKYAEFQGRFQSILERSEEHTKVIGLAQGRAGAVLELAFETLSDLSERIAVGPKK